MTFQLLQRVRILDSSDEHVDVHGEEGVVVKLCQMPDEPMPSISVLLRDEVIDDLFPGDLEAVGD